MERLNELSSIFVTHLDLLDDLEQFKMCTGYKVQSSSDSGEPHEIRDRMPATIKELDEWRATFEEIRGWN